MSSAHEHRPKGRATVSMEKLQIEIETNQASPGCSPHTSAGNFINFVMAATEKKARTPSQTPNRINKLSQMPRDAEDFKKYYEPCVVSIGPYHHNINGNTKLQQVQELKPIIAKRFLQEFSPESKDPIQLFTDFREQIKQMKVRSWYDAEATRNIDEEAFTQMMFLDGCFIIYFIYCIATFQVENLGMKNYSIKLVQRDLFLLENQLPFPVLKKLMTMKMDDDVWQHAFYYFIRLNIDTSIDWNTPVWDENTLHLLDLLRTKLLGICRRKTEKRIDMYRPLLRGTTTKSHMFRRVNYMFHGVNYMFRGVKELTAAGIHFRPKTRGCVRDVKFSSHCIYGNLTLPRMIIDSSTRQMFLNLIAYEACIDQPYEFGFTSYICFLDLLIDHADDVKELRNAGILVNHLGSDEDIAKLFNEIAADLVPEDDTFREVIFKIQTYLRRARKAKMALWLAEVYRDHFKSPWTASAVFAAIMILVATLLQTYFTIFPRADKCRCLFKTL